ncbi:tapasin-related protein [Scleropages formosus]|uniref:Si:ch211-108p6.4 n=1 Tax=Scleropages formosus TaxID=113540 RepID=A0A8C9V5J1_SCLFO|nr:tapasin-related protein-like [Scleropages formosus]
MRRLVKRLKLLGFLLSAVWSSGVLAAVGGIHWLPCRLVEEFYYPDSEGHTETKYQNRDVILQFGEAGDSPAITDTATFLVTAGTKLDMRQYAEGEPGELQCEIRRYSTGGIQMRWPGYGAQEHDNWFTCSLKHSEGLFSMTTFLRHASTTPTNPQDDYNKWTPIGDRKIVSTTAVMVVLTRSPSMEVGLLKDPALHCQFAVDHKRPDLTVEWRLQRHGERSKLFSYTSRSGKTEGAGLSQRAINNGDASLRLSPTTVASEGTYICSVYVPPLYGSQEIVLHILENPRVTINVGSALELPEGNEQKVVCEAQGYYPLDVEMEWLRERKGARLPEVLKNVLFSSHRHHSDGTYSLSSFFLLKPTLHDSGYTYSCRTSHRSLRSPIRKSFTLTVTDPVTWKDILFGIIGVGTVGFLIFILVIMLRYLHSAKKETNKKKPY